MNATMASDLVLQALLAAVWRRKPDPGVMVHSDQGSQFTSSDWQAFLKEHRMVPSMSRRVNCHDNAVAESFFGALEKGTHQAPDLSHAGGGGVGCVRLPRDVL